MPRPASRNGHAVSDSADSASIYKEIGRTIRRLRDERGMTQEALANAVGFTRASIANIERGRQKMLIDGLYRFGIALGVEPASLLPAPPGKRDAETDLLQMAKAYHGEGSAWVRKALSAAAAAKGG